MRAETRAGRATTACAAVRLLRRCTERVYWTMQGVAALASRDGCAGRVRTEGNLAALPKTSSCTISYRVSEAGYVLPGLICAAWVPNSQDLLVLRFVSLDFLAGSLAFARWSPRHSALIAATESAGNLPLCSLAFRCFPPRSRGPRRCQTTSSPLRHFASCFSSSSSPARTVSQVSQGHLNDSKVWTSASTES